MIPTFHSTITTVEFVDDLEANGQVSAENDRARLRACLTPPLDLALEVERSRRRGIFVLVPMLARDHPHHFELVAVGIVRVN